MNIEYSIINIVECKRNTTIAIENQNSSNIKYSMFDIKYSINFVKNHHCSLTTSCCYGLLAIKMV